jgi:hypothetical protein
LIFRGLNFSRNADIGQIGHFWMGTSSTRCVASESSDLRSIGLRIFGRADVAAGSFRSGRFFFRVMHEQVHISCGLLSLDIDGLPDAGS